ncbi:MAG: di-trans,poly-cis-decaprenylcistransferase [Deltaproteobacteria bacterium]|nr:di-trans,poly-cis-decaprenylcistransferase [Deltaproteobacteria bacterium]
MSQIPDNRVPTHVAIIMDGNGRWAMGRGLPRMAGHRAGVDAADRIVTAARELGVRYLTLFAFSDENWSRPADEVAGLMQLLEEFPVSKQPKMIANGIRFTTIGDRARLPASVRAALESTEAATAAGTTMTLILAVGYGAQTEICRAAERARAAGAAALTPEVISRHLDTAAFPDPDLFIRTSGEYRVSNYLLWQLAYTELYFTETLWPDFTEEGLREAIAAYARRVRRFGRVHEHAPEEGWRLTAPCSNFGS